MVRSPTVFLFALLCSPFAGAQAPKADPVDKAVAEAVAVLEKAAASASPSDKARLNVAILALKNAANKPIDPQNELISAFVDKPAAFKGQTLTFQVTYSDRPGLMPLDRRAKQSGVPFIGFDPKNGAKLVLGLTLPAGLDLPAAKDNEAVIVTFVCNDGSTSKGNVATYIRRP